MRHTPFLLTLYRRSYFLSTARLQQQAGAVLPISLIMLLLLTLIGVTGSQVTGLQEKMAGNMRDQSIAFQAAEAALRDAEQDILIRNIRTRNYVTEFDANCNKDNIENTADDGLCDRSWGRSAYLQPTYSGTFLSWPAFVSAKGIPFPAISLDMTTTPSVAYGAYTGTAAIPGLSAQPRYIIEGFERSVNGSITYFYRITTRAQGINSNTVVWLQEVYKPL